MNSKYFVPFETAKLLKEKGYPQITDYVFFLGKIVLNCTNDEKCMELSGIIAAPTYHEVVDWLEGKGIRVFAHYYIDNGKWVYVIEDFKRLQDNAGFFHTREEALNAAILKALELI